MSDNEEHILVIPRSLFDKMGAFQGIETAVDRYIPEMVSAENAYFLPRSAAEDDPAHKQVIPYCALCCGDKILRYFRGGNSGEARLRAKGSIGIGGHINRSDLRSGAISFDTYRRAVEREVSEELRNLGNFSDKIIALLNDDSNAVGRVHLGVVHRFDLESPDAAAGENDLQGLEFLTLEQLRAEYDRLETWSQILVDNWEKL